ncbi:hypothetical protein CUMW_121110 [Citrus unshiu]|nr:hypothetical protein CUMW_121110 [Citrus unshiu]
MSLEKIIKTHRNLSKAPQKLWLNKVSLVSVLTGWAHLGTFDRGKWVRSYSKSCRIDPKLTFNDSQILHYLSRNNLQDASNLLDSMSERNHPKSLLVHLTSSITKYSKRGFIDEAKALFQLMPQRNVVSYNAMLSGMGG